MHSGLIPVQKPGRNPRYGTRILTSLFFSLNTPPGGDCHRPPRAGIARALRVAIGHRAHRISRIEPHPDEPWPLVQAFPIGVPPPRSTLHGFTEG